MKSFVPPIEVQVNARRALEVRAEKPPSERGMLDEGISRARDLSNGRGISLDTIKRMNSFFARHEIDKAGSTWKTYGKGWQAWMGWGGDAGRRWARRIIALHDDSPASSSVGSTRTGTSIGKASPTANYNVQGGTVITGELARDKDGRFSNSSQAQQGGTQQSNVDREALLRAQPPLQETYAQYGGKLLESLGDNKYRDRRTGQEFTIKQKIPKDQQKQQNNTDTIKYLESSGLKATHTALSSLAIGATESINEDTKNRLHAAGLLDITPGGALVSAYGKRFLAAVDSNRDVSIKERMIKETLYMAEVHRKNTELKQQAQQSRQQPQQSRPQPQPQSRAIGRAPNLTGQIVSAMRAQNQRSIRPSKNQSSYIPAYLRRRTTFRRMEGAEMSDNIIRKSDTNRDYGTEAEGMAINQLYAIIEKAKEIIDILKKSSQPLEAWQAAQITTATHEINSVHETLIYSSEDKDIGKVMIAKNQLTNIPNNGKETTALTDILKFASFEKASPEQRIVVGYASSERVDGQNDIVDSEALNQALGDYMQWANLREMHQPKAIGKVLSATPVRGTIQLKDGSKLTNPLRIIAQIVDNDTWEKVKTGVLKGFSIGGKVLQALTEKMGGKDVRRITGLQLHEISLVDRPANPDARIVLMKRDDSVPVPSEPVVATPVADTVIAKASNIDPSKIMPQLQQLRNQAEMDGDLEQAERYNEVIALMLEAMGIIPQGTTRAVEGVESGKDDNENPMKNDNSYNVNSNDNFNNMNNNNGNEGMPSGMPNDMMSMDQVYAYNPAFQNTANVAYAQMPEDLQKAGRMLSSSTVSQLDQMAQAVQYIMMQIQQLKQQNASTPPMGAPSGAPMAPPPGQPPAGANPPQGQDMQAVPSDEIAAPTETPIPQVQSEMVPQPQPSSMAPSPETMAMLRGIGNPVLAANQQTGDLAKGAIDLASIEKEVTQMEQMTENSAPPMEAMAATEETPANPVVETEEVAKAVSVTPVIDIDLISKSISGVIASQLSDIVKQVERIETSAKEQHASLFETVNPLAEAINNTKAAVEPLLEKMSKLEPLVEKFDELSARIEAIENTPMGNSPVLRGTAVNKSLGGEAVDGTAKAQDELSTLHKMIDETQDPLVRTKLRERAAALETKRALFGRY